MNPNFPGRCVGRRWLVVLMLAGCAAADSMAAHERAARDHARASDLFRVMHDAIGGERVQADGGWIQCGTHDRHRYQAIARVRPADTSDPQAQREALLQAMVPLGFRAHTDPGRANRQAGIHMLSMGTTGHAGGYVNAWRKASGRDAGMWVFSIDGGSHCMRYRGADREVVGDRRRRPLS